MSRRKEARPDDVDGDDARDVLTTFGDSLPASELERRWRAAVGSSAWATAARLLGDLWPHLRAGEVPTPKEQRSNRKREVVWTQLAWESVSSLTSGDRCAAQRCVARDEVDGRWWIDTLFNAGHERRPGNYDDGGPVLADLRAAGFGVERVRGGGRSHRWLILGRDRHDADEPGWQPHIWAVDISVQLENGSWQVEWVDPLPRPWPAAHPRAWIAATEVSYKAELLVDPSSWDQCGPPMIASDMCCCPECSFSGKKPDPERAIEAATADLQDLIRLNGGQLPASLSMADLPHVRMNYEDEDD